MVGIPFSFLVTMIIMWLLDSSLNEITLFSFVLVSGIIVDDAIVVVENIYRHMQQGKSRQEAALIGTNQVAWPVITSTLTTLGAFSPLMFWPGIMGEFMGYLPLTLILALSASLFVALVINPVLSSRFQRVKAVAPKGNPHSKEPLVKRIYLVILKWCLRFRLLVVLSGFVMLVAAIAAFALFGKGTEFFPEPPLVEAKSFFVLLI